ncbi:hypothetical protein [Roseivirga pacifica]|nr:hypothetical protein [Roseivirga pacifica]
MKKNNSKPGKLTEGVMKNSQMKPKSNIKKIAVLKPPSAKPKKK